MSYYYKYDFVSPTPIYAIIKEELKSYFDTGAIDDLMFPTYLSKCLKKLSRATLPIKDAPLFIEDFEARLPDNFHAAREVWMCAETQLRPYQFASSFYSQSGTCVIQIAPVTMGGNPCPNNTFPDSPCCSDASCPTCVPGYSPGVYKSTEIIDRQYRQLYLLKPGNISASRNCSVDYNKNWSTYGQTPGASTIDSFDVRDNKLITNFRSGVVHMIFYSEEVDCDYNQLVPDNYRIQEYVEAFIKYKLFEVMTNQINDETFNQLQQKLQYYKQLSEEAFIMADIEVKKQTITKKVNRIYKDLNRFNKYEQMTPTSERYSGLFNRNK